MWNNKNKRYRVVILFSVILVCFLIIGLYIGVGSSGKYTEHVYAEYSNSAPITSSLLQQKATSPSNRIPLDIIGTYVEPKYTIVAVEEMKYKKGATIKFSTKGESDEEQRSIVYEDNKTQNVVAKRIDGGVVYTIPESWRSEFKSYMAYTAVHTVSTPQYRLLNSSDAYTNEYGLRMYKGRYCVAVASGIARTIGTNIDVILKNGTVLLCVLGDQKADSETGTHHMYHEDGDGSVVEFIVDMSVFSRVKDASGTVNFIPGWGGKIAKIVSEEAR